MSRGFIGVKLFADSREICSFHVVNVCPDGDLKVKKSGALSNFTAFFYFLVFLPIPRLVEIYSSGFMAVRYYRTFSFWFYVWWGVKLARGAMRGFCIDFKVVFWV